MSSEIDQKKLQQMWDRILHYLQNDSVGDRKDERIQKIMKIIDEVYRQCY